jgi:hypothetical protein
MKGWFLYASMMSTCLIAAPGCIDNSWHVKRLFDTKTYHLVTHRVGRYDTYCQCPCTKVSADRGICFQCGHAGPITRSSAYNRTSSAWLKTLKLFAVANKPL